GTAFHNHHDQLGYFPDGGELWDKPRTFTATGVPAQAPDQDWGWAYQILPFMEQDSLWRNPDNELVEGTPVNSYFCPSRRAPMVIKVGGINRAMLDYAGNGGTDTTKDPEETGGWGEGNGLNGTVVRRPNKTIYRSFRIDVAKISDGSSNTLLVAEKVMRSD